MDGTKEEHFGWEGSNTGTEMPHVLSTWREREIEDMKNT